MSEATLHGQPTENASLMAKDGGSYESPEEYADQGDTRVIRDLMFGYTVQLNDPAGNTILSAADAARGDEVSIVQIGILNLKKGEDNHSFYTTRELELLRNPAAAAAAGPTVTADNLSEQGEYELAEWLKTVDPETGKEPTIDQVLEAVGDDKELAHRMLQAENVATDGDPRKGLEAGLTRIIQG